MLGSVSGMYQPGYASVCLSVRYVTVLCQTNVWHQTFSRLQSHQTILLEPKGRYKISRAAPSTGAFNTDGMRKFTFFFILRQHAASMQTRY